MIRTAARTLVLIGLTLGLALIQADHAGAATRAPTAGDRSPRIHLIEVTGVINPLTTSYLQRALAEAERDSAELVIMRLDTPGGLDAAMREMTQVMLSSPVPVAVYVSPAGARAASAGMFLTLAAHVAAMAPGTNIGAAHPVALGAEVDETRMQKIAQDAAAMARSLAAARGRNPEWAERAVLDSISLTSAEALQHGLIDLVAADMDDLFVQLDGRLVNTVAGPVALRTAGAQTVPAPMNFAERLLHIVTDPNIAYLLLSLGAIALVIELQIPGFGLPGAVGVISLALAFVAFGSLPLNWAGIALIAPGILLIVVEVLSPGFGAPGLAGIAFFALGSLMLYRPFTPPTPTMPVVAVSPWLVGGVTASVTAFLFLAVGKGLRAQRLPVLSDAAQRLAGAEGFVRTEVGRANAVGVVQIGSETWSAIADAAEDGALPIRVGERVAVVGVKGIALRVRRVGTPGPDTDVKQGRTGG